MKNSHEGKDDKEYTIICLYVTEIELMKKKIVRMRVNYWGTNNLPMKNRIYWQLENRPWLHGRRHHRLGVPFYHTKTHTTFSLHKEHNTPQQIPSNTPFHCPKQLKKKRKKKI